MDIEFGKYILKSDRYQYWIEEKFENKNGGESRRRITGFYEDLSKLFVTETKERIRNAEYQSFKEAVEGMTAIEQEVIEHIRALSESLDIKINEAGGKSEYENY